MPYSSSMGFRPLALCGGLGFYPPVCWGKRKRANPGPAHRSNRPSQMLDLKVTSLILTFEKTIFFNIFFLNIVLNQT